MRVGLVLGAGGRVGAAYLAGVLTALEIDFGFDARTADVVIGTSAGSLVAAALRAGVPPTDLAAWAVGAPRSPAGAALPELADEVEFPPVSLRQFLRAPRVPSWSWVMRAARAPWRVDLMRSYLLHLPHGTNDLKPHLDWLDLHYGDRWPDDQMWLVAADARSGARRVIGRSVVGIDVRDAVAASCAVPGYFAPVRVGGHVLVDGGVVSTTNADLLARHDEAIDLAIVIAPMSTSAPSRRPDPVSFMRRNIRHQVDSEVQRLARAGIDTVRIEPGAEVAALAGFDFMAADHDSEIVRAAMFETAARLRREPLLPLLDLRHAARAVA